MRKFLAILVVAAFCASLSGCGLFTNVNQTFVKGVDGYAQVILPEYDAYLDRDGQTSKCPGCGLVTPPRLKPESVKLRKETVQKFRSLIDEGKKE